jgi:hypothetical protein
MAVLKSERVATVHEARQRERQGREVRETQESLRVMWPLTPAEQLGRAVHTNGLGAKSQVLAPGTSPAGETPWRYRHPALLGVCRERPTRSRSAEKCKEFPPSHECPPARALPIASPSKGVLCVNGPRMSELVDRDRLADKSLEGGDATQGVHRGAR